MQDIIKINAAKTSDPAEHVSKDLLILSFDIDFNLISANQAFLMKTGFTVEELKNMHFIKDLCKELPIYIEDELHYLLKQKKAWTGNFVLPSKNKRSLPFNSRIIPSKDDNQKFLGFTLIATEGKAQNDIISMQKSTESWMRSIFNSPEEANILVNTEGEIIDYNKSALQFVGWYTSKELIVEEQISNYFRKGFSTTFKAIFEKAKYGQRQKFVRNFKNKEGISKVADIELRPVISEADQIVGVIIRITDISAEVALEKKIRVSKKRLNDIAFINAHEVRAPLASILGLVNLLDFAVIDEDNRLILNHLKTAAANLDLIIRKVSENAYVREE